MKTSILFLVSIFFLFTLPTKAQDTPKDSTNYICSHIFTLAPLGLINKIRIRYEYVASKRMTYGAQASYYYDGIFPGFQLIGITRRYISRRSAPFGFYVMGQAGIAYHHATAYEGVKEKPNYTTWNFTTDYTYDYSHEEESYGATFSGNIGYQTKLDKKKRWFFDSYIGVKIYALTKNLDNVYVKPLSDTFTFGLSGSPYKKNYFSDGGDGIGNLWNAGINIGYRF